MKINCIAIDDEPLALDVIKSHVSKVPFLDLKGVFKNPFDAIAFLDNEEVDLMFVDIQMPELTGFEFLQALPKKRMVIFTTAYPNYAVESYEIDAVDYLLKPIPFDKFLRSVSKVKQRIGSIPNTGEPISAPTTSDDFIFVKTEYKTVKIFLKDILYVESLKDYVAFHLKDDRIMCLLSIRSVEDSLPSQLFMRVHRSFIVAVNQINVVERNMISINGETIPVGESYRDSFKGVIDSKKLS